MSGERGKPAGGQPAQPWPATPVTPPAAAAPVNADELEVVAGFAHDNLEGWIPKLANVEDIRIALEKAFDYRGDVTITRKDGTKISGYVFDRRAGATLETSAVRIIPQATQARLAVPYSEIAAIAFTGKDPAAGKSYEAWIKNYHEKRAQGETYNLEPESLDEP